MVRDCQLLPATGSPVLMTAIISLNLPYPKDETYFWVLGFLKHSPTSQRIALLFEPLGAKWISVHFLMRSSSDWRLWEFCMLAIRSAREGIRHFARKFIMSYSGFLIALVFLSKQNPSIPDPAKFICSVVVGAIVMSFVPGRSRYIPRSERRKIKGHGGHIDHIWPYWLGGSNTADNLRRISAKRNLRKGGKLPKLWDWF